MGHVQACITSPVNVLAFSLIINFGEPHLATYSFYELWSI